MRSAPTALNARATRIALRTRVSRWQSSAHRQLIDEAEDAGETDVDCGGACRGCIPGQKCLVDADCTTNECDPTKHTCGGNSCADKLEDGDESDVDCGGPECGGCLNGKKCNSSFDCADGTCQANVIPHICK